INALLGDLIKDRKEGFKHLQIASEIFNDISNFSNPKIENTFLHFNYLFGVARTGIIFAKNSINESEKVNYYLTAIDLLIKSKKISISLFRIENLFLIGDLYYEVGELTNDDNIFKKSYSSYIEAIGYCKDKGYSNLVGSGYVKLAQIEDRLGNFLSAAENYKKAIDSFDKAILTLTYSRASKKIEKLKNYMKAWEIIETAKSYHVQEEHDKAQFNYEQASQILKNLREYNFESPFYSAWALLEKAELLSKMNKHQEAAATYLVSKGNFEDVIETFNSYISKRKLSKETERISKLIQVAEIRGMYCTARYQIETARLESKNGNHLLAAELYNKASSLFYKICQTFRLKRDKDELTAIFFLCKAWESMERADIEQNTTLYAIASDLFEKAGTIFPEQKLKKLSLGNSLYCSALECGSLFDDSTELEKKINYYKKIKMYLREAAKNYKLGGFDQDAQWALGTSTFFDGVWHLIQADNELDFTKKNQYLNIATNYLNKSLNIFEQADYEHKKEEILNYLEMISNEKAILTSALNVIEKPEISASSVGISAPTYPVEISSSVNIEEMQETDLKTESEINWRKRIHYLCIFLKNGISIYDYTFKSKSEISQQLITGEDLSPHLIAGGLSGISALIQELTQSRTKVKIVEQEEMTILLENGRYVTAALITEENLITLRNKLMQLIIEIEDFFQEELENFAGNIDVFSKIGKFVQKIFEI
ncbi:MAG: tetratricopeptide repeat protein, partial [Candidatus Hodarchaeota archaeon]